MTFYADLHIHSKWSRACSQDCDLEHLSLWAQQKGITVVGTTVREASPMLPQVMGRPAPAG